MPSATVASNRPGEPARTGEDDRDSLPRPAWAVKAPDRSGPRAEVEQVAHRASTLQRSVGHGW